MFYNRKNILEALSDTDGIELISSAEDSNENGIFFLWKTQKVFLSITDNTNHNDANAPQFSSPYALNIIYRPSTGMDFISVIDKYRISNYVTANTHNVASACYRESSDAFQIKANYNPMIENLSTFKQLSDDFKATNLRYSILYLMSLCFDMAGEVSREIISFIEKNDEFNQKIKDF
ncbi:MULTISPECIES: hypothetical protein [Enterobacter cloacae complex]|uniref:hypothetical protein n=1 Tax=Enterobacter cloacae complex TaxID=354276 RepID=UPI002005A896|nr:MULTISPECIES: hypothetical protein [Enterobacter cloacae complex]HAS1185076.1 hypothetical protein [Enterobacter cloacae]HAV1777734.1 hypothetical protein [Enterobacter hormaechei subsp. steigerwaltii]MCK6957421.1 hypothetical protein [Enterobacter kobei]MCK7342714.1 hypothetical protein [Enterobacter kobei]MCM7445217.1 hypothetical protein [Enterobacter hormaechei]